MALKKVKSIHTSPLSPLNLTTHFFYSFGGLNGLNRKSEPSLNSMKDQLSTFTGCHLLTNEKTTILLTGAAIMFFSLAGIAFIIWLNIPSTPFIVVILVIIFNGPGFGTSWGPLAWFIPS